MRKIHSVSVLPIVFVSLLAAPQTVSNLSSNNTSACVAGSGTSASPCSTTFPNMTDPRAGVNTPVFNAVPAQTSTADVLNLLYPGAQTRTTKVFAHLMAHFVAPGTTQSAPGIPPCPSSTGYLTPVPTGIPNIYKCPENLSTNPPTGDNAITDYTTALQATVQKQLADVTRRGFDGVTVDWYRGTTTSQEVMAGLVAANMPAANPGGKYAILYNGATLRSNGNGEVTDCSTQEGRRPSTRPVSKIGSRAISAT